MKKNRFPRAGFLTKRVAAVLCGCLLLGGHSGSVFAEEAVALHALEAEALSTQEASWLVDIHCSGTAKEALSEEQLKTLVELIVTKVEPQAVNRIIECFPCFQEAAAKDELGREISLYIYDYSPK